jgi:HEAT repeat protein
MGIRGILSVAVILSLHAIATGGCQDKDDGKAKGKTVKELVEILKSSKEAGEAAKAAKALGEFGPKAKEAIPALAEAVKDNRNMVAEAASAALGVIGPDAIPALRELVKGKNGAAQARAVKAMASISSKKSDTKDKSEGFVELLKKDPDAEVRTAAVYFGVQNFDLEAKKKALPALIAGLKDKNGEVVIACGFVLGMMRKDAKSAVAELVAVAKDTKRDEDVRETCITALMSIGPDAKEAVKDLVTIAQKDKSDGLRGMAAKALAEIDPEAAKKLRSKKKNE